MNSLTKLATGAAMAAMALPTAAVAQTAPAPDAENKTNAAQTCKLMRGTGDASRSAFVALIASQNPGTKVTASNAFGKCVSAAAKKDARQEKTAKSNAAKDCKAQTPAPKGRAFGKCVSTKAKAKKAAADKAENEQARETLNAAKFCKAIKPVAPKGRAFGKCVSERAKAQNDDKPAEQTTTTTAPTQS